MRGMNLKLTHPKVDMSSTAVDDRRADNDDDDDDTFDRHKFLAVNKLEAEHLITGQEICFCSFFH